MKNKYIGFVLLLLWCIGCSPGLKFNEEAYQRDTNIEQKVSQLLPHTSEPYASHAAEIVAIKSDIDYAISKESERKGNTITVKMWQAVQQDKGNLYDLFELWRTNDKLSPAISADINKKAERLLASITELEAHKNK